MYIIKVRNLSNIIGDLCLNVMVSIIQNILRGIVTPNGFPFKLKKYIWNVSNDVHFVLKVDIIHTNDVLYFLTMIIVINF